MSTDNPYVPPQVDVDPVLAEPVQPISLWRQRDLLVAAFGSDFPDRCPLTNLPATTRYPYEFSSLPLVLKLFLIFCGVGIWLTLLADSSSSKIRLSIPLDDQAVRRLRMHYIFGFLAAGLAIALIAIAALVPSAAPIANWLVGPGFLILVGSLIWLNNFSGDLVAQNVTATHAWISGAHPDFLARLPEWQRPKA